MSPALASWGSQSGGRCKQGNAVTDQLDDGDWLGDASGGKGVLNIVGTLSNSFQHRLMFLDVLTMRNSSLGFPPSIQQARSRQTQKISIFAVAVNSLTFGFELKFASVAQSDCAFSISVS